MTKFIILAAGKGKRLYPLTKKVPKALIEISGIPILLRQIDIVKKVGISDIHVVTGYLNTKIDDLVEQHKISTTFNEKFENTNMVFSLFKAINFFQNSKEDIIISYGDIIYEKKILLKLLSANSSFSTIIDLNWFNLWSERMDTPLDDAESLMLDQNDNILEIGNKTSKLENIQGQFIGLIKIKNDKIKYFIDYYKDLNCNIKKNNLFMTDFLQLLINSGNIVKAVKINGGWLEIDTLKDLKVYEEMIKLNTINKIINL